MTALAELVRIDDLEYCWPEIISELNGERESETNREGDSSWHDDSDVSDQQLDDDHTEEASTSLGNRKEIRNSEKAKVSSETQKGRRAKGKSVRKTTSNNKNNNTKGKPRKAREKTKGKALTLKELDDLVKKLDEKRSMCWNFVSGEFKNQYVVQHYKTHRELINEILDDKYNELSSRPRSSHVFISTQSFSVRNFQRCENRQEGSFVLQNGRESHCK